MIYEEIKGDLIKLTLKGKFDVITHGCNCFCLMGAGIALQMAKTFDCNNPVIFKKENPSTKEDFDKLGCIDYSYRYVNTSYIVVINSYTQYQPGANLDYVALRLCMRKINAIFPGQHIGLPLIGCGIAGGDWEKVKKIIKQELKNMKKVTIVKFKKNEI